MISAVTYFYLALAIVFEVIATSSLKSSEGLTRVIPSIISAIGYLITFYFLALTLRTMPIGIAYESPVRRSYPGRRKARPGSKLSLLSTFCTA